MTIRLFSILMALAMALAAAMPAQAQYPNRPVRVIVPFPPGSANDRIVRFIQQEMSQALGQQLVVENRAGAGGNLGAEVAAKSTPDGYTIMVGNIAQSISASLYTNLGYDFVKDFTPISLVATGSFMLVSHPSLPPKTVKELIAFTKQRPGEVNVATSGAAIQLAAKLFQDMTGTKLTEINYKGTPQAITSVISGETSLGFPSTSSAMPQVRAHKMRALAVTTLTRSSMAPKTPTLDEVGIKGFNVTSWYGLVAPAGTPREIIAKLHDATIKAIKHPAVVKRFSTTDLDSVGSTPEKFGELIKSETERWGKMVRAAGMKAN